MIRIFRYAIMSLVLNLSSKYTIRNGKKKNEKDKNQNKMNWNRSSIILGYVDDVSFLRKKK
jgi:hypothetical protein